jgi:hypothetical protein
MKRLLSLAFAALLGLTGTAHAQPIDRKALVDRNSPVLERVDPHAPLMLGNGDLGFTADITGLQTFPDAYDKLSPLLTMAQWAWHSFPNPNGYTEADGLVPVSVAGRGEEPYAWMKSFEEVKTRPALAWLRENPHRFSLGRMGLVMTHADGRPAAFADLTETRQRLDLWSGTLESRFRFDGQPVAVQTRVHPQIDMVVAEITSPLVASGRLAVNVRYPGVSTTLNPNPADFDHPEKHRTEVLTRTRDRVSLRRTLDETILHSVIDAPGAEILDAGAHSFTVAAASGDRLVVMVRYSDTPDDTPAPSTEAIRTAVADHWRGYWSGGGVIDFTGSTDPRAKELERRVVLSQYLQAINGAGELPPQEEGLFSNSWNGKFHLEMHAWHSGHFAPWGRPALLARSLPWYAQHLEAAKAEARRHHVEGAWWPKMSGPEGRNSPSPINPFIMWQQPHPIYMAELMWRAEPTPQTLAAYGAVVEETAKLLASWPRQENGRYVLGPPIIPVQENHPPLTTKDPAFEVAYFRWALQTAQAWRERRGLSREPQWDRVIAGLGPLPMKDGLYLPVASTPDFWARAASPACSRNAEDHACLNRDHFSFLMAYGLIGSDLVDLAAMRRTFQAMEAHWDARQTWGWDFPMAAMAAARLGYPEKALDWLFKDLKNNQWGVSGMTPRVHVEAHAQQFTPGAGSAVGPDGPGYRRAANTYFPSNGSLLLAVGMMAAGWDGSEGPAPGFPKQGWTVRVEGIRPIP